MTSTSTDRPITDDDLSFIAETMDQPRKMAAEALGRTLQSITHMRRIIRNGDPRQLVRWSEYEDRVIENSVGIRTAEEIALLLPNRTPKSIRGRISTLGIKLGYGANKSPLNIGSRQLIAKTCPRCGMLLPAEWYNKRIVKGRDVQTTEAWRSYCRKCNGLNEVTRARPVHATAGDWARRAQALTVPLADNNHQEYTEADYLTLSDESITTLAKALLLKRSYKAVSAMLTKMGYKSKRGLGSAAGDQWLIDNPNASRIEEITAMLNQPEPEMPIRPDFEWDD